MPRKAWPFKRYPINPEITAGHVDMLEGGCGVGNISDFGDTGWGIKVKDLLWSSRGSYTGSCGGTGLSVASFIDSEECNQIYRDIKKHWKILWQSEVRINGNSGNHFFFVVFDIKKAKDGNS